MLLDHLTRNIRGLIHRRRATETPPLFFMHIPKNAGTSLIYLLANRFPAAACLLFADWPASQTQDVNQFRFVSGHIGYQYLERFRLRPNVVTFLRHPLDRAVSSFFFIKTAGPERIRKLREKATQEGDLCQLRLLDDVCRLDLRDFLRE